MENDFMDGIIRDFYREPITPVGARGLFPGLSIQNKDGSSSSEQTISIGIGDKEYLIPTVVKRSDGTLEKVSNDEAIKLFRAGLNPYIGVYNSPSEANRQAGFRSSMGGRNFMPMKRPAMAPLLSGMQLQPDLNNPLSGMIDQSK